MTLKQKGTVSLPKTAAIIIIGDEILSGKVRDTNSHYLTRELRSLGVDVKRISVIADDVTVIGEEVLKASKTYNYVFTAGGIGPTHDDRTVEGITKGFGIKAVTNEGIVKIIKARCGERTPDDLTMKMALLPQGAQIITREGMKFPVVVFKNIFIFPGIPSFLRQKFSAIKDRFRSEPFHLKRVYVNEEECFMASHLEKVAGQFPDVSVGSYPDVEAADYKGVVTIESINEKSLLKAYKLFLRLIPPEIVIKVE